MRLDELISVLPQHPGFCEIQKQLARKNQSASQFEILLHPLGVNKQPVNQIGGLGQQIVDKDGRVRKDDALDRRMRDVALVPERNVLHRRLRVAAKYARQAADLLARDRILFVRHGRGAFLLFAEVLLRLANLGALQVADFDGNLVQRAADNGERCDIGCMAIALDNLRGHRRRLQPQPRANALFVLRLQMAEGAHSARQLADAHVLSGGGEACGIALHLGIPVEQLQTKCRRLRMNPMCPADGGRQLELDGAAL